MGTAQHYPDGAARVKDAAHGAHWEPAILVLDDSDLVLRALARDLERLGHRVFTAMTQDEAASLVQEELIETVIVDLFLGSEDGLVFLRQLKQGHRGINRILMSGHSRPCQLALGTSLGVAHEFIPKPWTLESLASALEGMEEGGDVRFI